MSFKKLLYYVFIFTVILTVSETYYRKTDATSVYRPTIFLMELSTFLGEWAYYLGSQLASLLDIFTWVKEALIDYVAVVKELAMIVIEPCFEFLRGWTDYFTKNVVDTCMVKTWCNNAVHFVLIIVVLSLSWAILFAATRNYPEPIVVTRKSSRLN